MVVDGRTHSVVVGRQDFGRLFEHAALDAQHHGGVLDGVGGDGHGLVDVARSVGSIGHLDDIRLTREDGLIGPRRDGAATTRLGFLY